MVVIHVLPNIFSESGGTSTVVADLCQSLISREIDCKVLLSESSSKDIYLNSNCSKIIYNFSYWNFISRVFFFKNLDKIFPDDKDKIFHIHGIWHPFNHFIISWLKHRKIPYVVHIHGMLEVWAISYKKYKKIIAGYLYQKNDLKMAKTLIVSSNQELLSVKKYIDHDSVCIAGNGIFPIPDRIKNTKFGKKRDYVFISRVHPKKGLLNFLKAWSQVSPLDSTFTIAGPNENSHLEEVLSLVYELGLQDRVRYVGTVDGELKVQLLSNAFCLVLPTFSENFGMIVLEALEQGIPVITTLGTPWEVLNDERCGWCVEPTVDGLVKALRASALLNEDSWLELSSNAKNLAKSFYWDSVIQGYINIYKGML